MIPQNFDWFVVQNNPDDKFDRPLEFHIIEGEPRPTQKFSGFVGVASYHHALGLNKACRYLAERKIYSRYVLLLDPDFFIVPRLDTCVDYMKEKGLAFFGAPYAIEPAKKRIQDFPVGFCMFIDTQQIALDTLDFSPQTEDTKDYIGDTGYLIYKQYKDSGIKYEAALPHFGGDTKHPHIGRNLSSAYGLEPSFIPDQYFWNKRLFGLHCHMKLHLRNGKEAKVRSLLQTNEIKRLVKNVRRQDEITV